MDQLQLLGTMTLQVHQLKPALTRICIGESWMVSCLLVWAQFYEIEDIGSENPSLKNINTDVLDTFDDEARNVWIYNHETFVHKLKLSY